MERKREVKWHQSALSTETVQVQYSLLNMFLFAWSKAAELVFFHSGREQTTEGHASLMSDPFI